MLPDCPLEWLWLLIFSNNKGASTFPHPCVGKYYLLFFLFCFECLLPIEQKIIFIKFALYLLWNFVLYFAHIIQFVEEDIWFCFDLWFLIEFIMIYILLTCGSFIFQCHKTTSLCLYDFWLYADILQAWVQSEGSRVIGRLVCKTAHTNMSREFYDHV